MFNRKCVAWCVMRLAWNRYLFFYLFMLHQIPSSWKKNNKLHAKIQVMIKMTYNLIYAINIKNRHFYYSKYQSSNILRTLNFTTSSSWIVYLSQCVLISPHIFDTETLYNDISCQIIVQILSSNSMFIGSTQQEKSINCTEFVVEWRKKMFKMKTCRLCLNVKTNSM